MLIKHTKAHAYGVNHERVEAEVDEVTDWPESISKIAVERYGAEEVGAESIHEVSGSDSGNTGNSNSDVSNSDSTNQGDDSTGTKNTPNKTETTVTPLSKPTMKAIKKSGKGIDELKTMTREDLIDLPGIGEKSADEILNHG